MCVSALVEETECTLVIVRARAFVCGPVPCVDERVEVGAARGDGKKKNASLRGGWLNHFADAARRTPPLFVTQAHAHARASEPCASNLAVVAKERQGFLQVTHIVYKPTEIIIKQ